MLPYRLKIFISSTIKDMPNEREAALLAIREFGADPLMSEYTINAQNDNSVNACLEKVRSSDIYILILGGRYGWQPFNDKSITEMEYLTAQEQNVPTLVFNTEYDKEKAQFEFANKVGATFFWKPVKNAFELKDEIFKALQEEVEKWKTAAIETTELLYANMLKTSFPQTLFIADLNLDRDEIIEASKQTETWLKKSASWYDVTVAAIHQKNIRFPHDWVCDEKKLITFHDLSDHALPLSQLIDLGTVTSLPSEDFYLHSDDKLKVFKSLLRNCLKTKLYKLGIKWFKEEKLFAFLPVVKDSLGRWKNREITWQRLKKATRTVAKCQYKKSAPLELKNIWHLAFATNFYFIDEQWYMSIKPDWLITFGDFKVSWLSADQISEQKRKERNIHIFNHLNFILWYLQPDDTMVMFDDMQGYKFLTIRNFATIDSYPIVPDKTWIELESKSAIETLSDTSGEIDLFTR